LRTSLSPIHPKQVHAKFDAHDQCAYIFNPVFMGFQSMNVSAKKAANLTVRADLLDEAKAFKINLSQTLENALISELKKRREAAWLEENKAAIEAYNREVEKNGLFSDAYRNFC